MLRFVFISLLLLYTNLSFAQQSSAVEPIDTASQKPEKKDTVIQDTRLFNGIRLGVDVAGFAYDPMVDYKFTNFAVTGDFGIKKWFLVADLGRASFNRSFNLVDKFDESVSNSYSYTNSGQYIRLGADYRISKSAKSFLFVGGRFGQAIFNESLSYSIKNGEPPNVIQGAGDLSKSNTSASWGEGVMGIKVYLLKNLYMGYTIRFKFRLGLKQGDKFETMDIPGFGVASRANGKGTNVGFSFNIMYRIPFGKDPEIPLKGR